MSNDFKVIPPDSEHHEGIAAAVQHSDGLYERGRQVIDYNALAEKYNEAPIGTVILLALPSSYRIANMVRVLAGRGLVKDQDFVAVRIVRDMAGKHLPPGDRAVSITKVSTAEIRVI